MKKVPFKAFRGLYRSKRPCQVPNMLEKLSSNFFYVFPLQLKMYFYILSDTWYEIMVLNTQITQKRFSLYQCNSLNWNYFTACNYMYLVNVRKMHIYTDCMRCVCYESMNNYCILVRVRALAKRFFNHSSRGMRY